MKNTQSVSTNVAAFAPPSNSALVLGHNKHYSDALSKLLNIKSQGYDWIRTYEIPGRKLLRKIVSETYAVFMSIEALDNPMPVYERLAARLRSDKVRIHVDAPNSATVVRTVFPSLDSSRVSKYARALDAAKEKGINTDKFEDFVASAGGFEKIRLAPITVLVPGRAAMAATPDSFKTVVLPVEEEEVDDLNDGELEELEFGDELYELLQHRKAEPFLAVFNLSAEQQARIDQSQPERVVLIAELHDGELRIFDQVPWVDEAIAKAYRVRYPTCQDLRNATPQKGRQDSTVLNGVGSQEQERLPILRKV